MTKNLQIKFLTSWQVIFWSLWLRDF